jgi:alpha-D-xyloside xylohydrolase
VSGINRRSALAILALLSASAAADAAEVDRVKGGVVVTPDAGQAKRVRVLVYGDGLFRVTATPETKIDLPDSLMVIAEPGGEFAVAEDEDSVTLTTPRGSAEVRLADGFVTVRDARGQPLLQQARPAQFWDVTAGGKPFLGVSQQFNRATSEGFYGLGQHQQGVMDYRGHDVELAQHNMDIAVPFVVSTKNYGLLWDNYSITRFGDPRPYRFVGEDALKVVGANGEVGFTAEYYLGDKLIVRRNEAKINYQYIRDQKNYPVAAKASTVAATGGQNTAGNSTGKERVVWRGQVTPQASGTHKFQLYASSYFKLYADGKLVLDRWRQNWNPWYHDFDLPMTAGRSVDIRIEWEPNAGYIGFFHNDPLPAADHNSLWMTSEAARAIDYYVVAAGDMDGVISGYRTLTGKASMMPKWAYGFWQSRQRYETADQLLGVVREYRKQGIPLDNIVQDWFYWREDDWGSHRFDPTRFPDPKGMIDEVHGLNARFMISVWPKFYPTTDTYKELEAAGHVYQGNLTAGNKDWVGPGYLNTDYDPYAKEARAIYWRQMRDRLAALGIDAWWMDATEPDIHSNLSIEERKAVMGPTAEGPAELLFNSFPLVHACGVHQGTLDYKPDVRPFILTRSGYGGIQRCGSALWSGDVASRWDDLREQISAGINISMSGIPNWTHDIGGFALEDRYTRQDPAHLDEWRELNLRWFQFGAFSPLFRSHGEAPKREIFEIAPAGSAMRRSMVWYDELRYRLMPYIYTIAADTHHKDGTMMRGLVMDFPGDPKVRDIADQYLFGPSFLVAPVTAFKARSRQVYLPAGASWYDFDAGGLHRGGRTVTARAPYERMPLFIRAGSIVPVGPVTQYVDEKPGAPLTIHVYTGTDGVFSLYEDDGVSNDFGKGAFARIPMRWDDAAGTLTFGAREGSYDGMAATREFRVRFVGPRSGGFDPGTPADRTITYTGAPATVSRR